MECPLCDVDCVNLTGFSLHLAREHKKALTKPHEWFCCVCGVVVASCAGDGEYIFNHCAEAVKGHLSRLGIVTTDGLYRHILGTFIGRLQRDG